MGNIKFIQRKRQCVRCVSVLHSMKICTFCGDIAFLLMIARPSLLPMILEALMELSSIVRWLGKLFLLSYGSRKQWKNCCWDKMDLTSSLTLLRFLWCCWEMVSINCNDIYESHLEIYARYRGCFCDKEPNAWRALRLSECMYVVGLILPVFYYVIKRCFQLLCKYERRLGERIEFGEKLLWHLFLISIWIHLWIFVQCHYDEWDWKKNLSLNSRFLVLGW